MIHSLLLLLLPSRAVAFSHILTSRLTIATVKTLEFELRVPMDLMFERIASVVSLTEPATDKLSAMINIVLLFTTSIKGTVDLTKQFERPGQTPHAIKKVTKQLFVYDESKLAHLIQRLLCIQKVMRTETRDQIP
jgi:hypothetical protein